MEGNKLGSIQFLCVLAIFLSLSVTLSTGCTVNSSLNTPNPTTETALAGQSTAVSSTSSGDLYESEQSQEKSGVDGVLSQTDRQFPQLTLRLPDCQKDSIEFSGVGREIQGPVASEDMGRILLNTSCVWTLTVPDGMLAVAEFTLTSDPCPHQLGGNVHSGGGSRHGVFSCMQTQVTIWSTSHQIRFQLQEKHHAYQSKKLPEKYPEIRIRFTAIPEPNAHEADVEFLSMTSDYVTQFNIPLFNELVDVRLKGEYLVQAPEGHHTMVSFPLFPQGPVALYCANRVFELLAVETLGNTSVIWKYCDLPTRSLPATVYNTSLTIHYDFLVWVTFRGFKILFSFHREKDVPRRLENGLLDCSGHDYATFKQHVQCNLEVECEGGEDEGEHCSFSPPGCRGKVGYKDTCYSLVSSDKPVTWLEADTRCREDGGQGLAMMKTEAQWQAFRDIFRYGKLLPETFIGLTHYNSSMPYMYRFTQQWKDGTVLYDRSTHHNGKLLRSPPRYKDSMPDWIVIDELIQTLNHFACQFDNLEYVDTELGRQTTLPQLSLAVILPSGDPALSTLSHGNLTLVLCAPGHVTHHFLSHDPHAHCTSDLLVTGWHQDSMVMFVCENGRDVVPYLLVCDFRRDCADGSDETFCHHGNCQGFSCANGQCVFREKLCDLVTHCLDGSDEDSCRPPSGSAYDKVEGRQAAPALVHFHDNGSNTMIHISKWQPCPDTHFRCPGESDYCLPVYVRCNGVYDCLGHEDEVDCQDYTCPGFYRCRASSVCVHLDHLCDGWPQCPQRDDELLCDFTCPAGCHCQGLAFVCQQPFAADNYPQLRYLDASGSGMSPDDVSSNGYLVFLRLSSCQLYGVQDLVLNNLKTLDLSNNFLREFRLDSLLSLENMEVLILAGNPLASLFSGKSDTRHSRLKALDISHTHLHVLGGSVFLPCPAIQSLNISFSNIKIIAPFSLKYLPRLTVVDMRGLFLQDSPDGLLKGLSQLQEVSADDYRLCCENVLPEEFTGLCLAPEGDFSSCEQLIGSGMFRVAIWAVGVLAVVGNIYCALKQMLLPRAFDRGIGVIIFIMHVANLGTGMYFLILAVGDQVLAGGFMYHEKSWRSGAICHVAGFLWLASGQAVLLLVLLFTLDRLLVLTFIGDHQSTVGEQAELADRSSDSNQSALDPKTPVTQFLDPLSSKSSAKMGEATCVKNCFPVGPPPMGLFLTRRFAAAVCLAVMCVSALLASVPFFPPSSDWQFYSQTTFCLPLSSAVPSPQDRNSFFMAIMLLSFLLSLFIAAGQCVISRSVRMAIRRSGLVDLSQDVTTAKSLISVAGMACLCWLSIGLVGVMIRAGVSEADGLFKSLVVYLVSVNAAINPLVYTYSVRTEKQRAVEKTRMIVLLRSRATSSVLLTASQSQYNY